MDAYIKRFIQLAVQENHIHPMDAMYVQNQLLAILKKDELNEHAEPATTSLLETVDALVQCAASHQKVVFTSQEEDQLSSAIMACITPLPSVVNHTFWQYYQHSPQNATHYFYSLSKQLNYIKTREIAKNTLFEKETEYGKLQITINLSKPEKDPKEIARKPALKKTYPSSLLSMDNEGYYGREDYAARSQHRVIRLTLQDEPWGFQYSPYSYFNEHSIFFSQTIRPMNVTSETLQRLLEIVELFPHYFVGSNAGLPIVGGSILSHDHYQAGRHTFPMDKASVRKQFSIRHFSGEAAWLHWPMSVIRLRSPHKEELLQAATFVLHSWENYSDPSIDLISHTQSTPHNAITPIVRFTNNSYEMDLVLRNNRTCDEYPDGIFHPHPDVQHIKKENIGLIEVMGLAILPPRLHTELQDVAHHLLNPDHPIHPIHMAWATQLKNTFSITKENVEDVLQIALAQRFKQILEDAGIFKQTPEGEAAMMKFIQTLA